MAVGQFWKALIAIITACFTYLVRYLLNHAQQVVDVVKGNRGAVKILLDGVLEGAKQDAELITELKPLFNQAICAVAEDELQIKLDPAAPLSGPSISAAISVKTGIPLSNILDKEAVKRDVMAYGVTEAAARTGLHLNPQDPFSKASITAAIANASGIPLTDITNKEQIRADLMAYGKAQMAAEIGERVNGKMAALVNADAVNQMEMMVGLANQERQLMGMPELKRDQIAQRMNAVDAIVRSAAQEELASYETKVCNWSKDLARKGAQVMASRRYRERMKQAGFSKKWARGGAIKGDAE